MCENPLQFLAPTQSVLYFFKHHCTPQRNRRHIGHRLEALDRTSADPPITLKHNQRSDWCTVGDQRKDNCGYMMWYCGENRSALASDIVNDDWFVRPDGLFGDRPLIRSS